VGTIFGYGLLVSVHIFQRDISVCITRAVGCCVRLHILCLSFGFWLAEILSQKSHLAANNELSSIALRPIKYSIGSHMRATLKHCALLILGYVLAGCSPCENVVSQSISSPSGEYKAVVFSRNCGATVEFNTQISVLRSSDILRDDAGKILVLGGSIPLKIKWLDNSKVSIEGLSNAKIFKKSDFEMGISVSYEK